MKKLIFFSSLLFGVCSIRDVSAQRVHVTIRKPGHCCRPSRTIIVARPPRPIPIPPPPVVVVSKPPVFLVVPPPAVVVVR